MSCPVCDREFKKYGFSLREGLHCYTASERACCPKQVVVKSFNAREVRFTTKDGQEHGMPLHDFMKSSWIDRTDL